MYIWLDGEIIFALSTHLESCKHVRDTNAEKNPHITEKNSPKTHEEWNNI